MNLKLTNIKKNSYNAAVVGLGNIGFKFSLDPKVKKVYSHSEIYNIHPSINFVNGVDICEDNCKLFHDVYNKRPFKSIDDLFKQNTVDIISICTPAETHYSIIKKIPLDKVKLIFCEKPISNIYSEGLKIKKLVSASKCKIAVNYIRRWSEIYIYARKQILSNQIGKIKSVSVKFTGGAYNIGTHMFDISRFLVGDLNPIQCQGIISKDHEGTNIENDKNISGYILMEEEVIFSFLTVAQRLSKIVEIEVFGSDGIIKIIDDTIFEKYNLIDHPDFTRYKIPNMLETKKFNENNHFYNSIDNIINHIENDEKLNCTIDDALCSLNAIEKLISSNL